MFRWLRMGPGHSVCLARFWAGVGWLQQSSCCPPPPPFCCGHPAPPPPPPLPRGVSSFAASPHAADIVIVSLLQPNVWRSQSPGLS